MALPIPANATCDIYFGVNAPPNPPDVAGVPCYLEECFSNLKPVGGSPGIVYDHIMRVEKATDVRDDYNGASGPTVVYVPNQDGTGFKVESVARVARGTAMDHKILYLQRTAITWPTNDV